MVDVVGIVFLMGSGFGLVGSGFICLNLGCLCIYFEMVIDGLKWILVKIIKGILIGGWIFWVVNW